MFFFCFSHDVHACRFVKICFIAGVFSESMVLALEFYNKNYPEFLETAPFLKFVLNVWKVMSLKTPSKGQY